MGIIPLMGTSERLQALGSITQTFTATPKMPVLFIGHGSPMNAIEENEFVQGFRNIATTLPQPQAILCISAHWETKGTRVTAMQMPKTIHDFGGFPKELYEVQYPAPGSPELAKIVTSMVDKTQILCDDSWGLDHGAWSVIRQMYPQANIPVIQMSIDYSASPEQHYEIGKQLSALRKKGVLIIGSGNIVHNLRLVDWNNFDKDNYAYEWAQEASNKIKTFITENNHKAIIDFRKMGKAFDLAIPTPEHYIPLIYSLSLQDKGDLIYFFNDKAIAGSLTMTSLKLS